jgi:hypothetical protein
MCVCVAFVIYIDIAFNNINFFSKGYIFIDVQYYKIIHLRKNKKYNVLIQAMSTDWEIVVNDTWSSESDDIDNDAENRANLILETTIIPPIKQDTIVEFDAYEKPKKTNKYILKVAIVFISISIIIIVRNFVLFI